MSMVSTTICWDCSSMVASLPMLTISSWATMSTEASNHLRLCAFYSHTKLNIPRTSSYWEETTNAHRLTESMVSTMSASAATTSSCGRLSLTASTAYLLLLLLTRKFFVCTVVLAQSLVLLSKSRELWDPLMSLTLVSFAISSGQTLTRTFKDGVKTTAVCHSLSVKKSFQLLIRSMTSIWFVVLIRSLKTATSFSRRDSSLLSFLLPTIAVNSIMPVLWWVLMTL